MLQRGTVVEYALQPPGVAYDGEGDVMSQAYEFPESILNSFKPHSNYGLGYVNGLGPIGRWTVYCTA